MQSAVRLILEVIVFMYEHVCYIVPTKSKSEHKCQNSNNIQGVHDSMKIGPIFFGGGSEFVFYAVRQQCNQKDFFIDREQSFCQLQPWDICRQAMFHVVVETEQKFSWKR